MSIFPKQKSPEAVQPSGDFDLPRSYSVSVQTSDFRLQIYPKQPDLEASLHS